MLLFSALILSTLIKDDLYWMPGTYWYLLVLLGKEKSTVFKQDPLRKLQAAFTLSLEEKSSAFFCVVSSLHCWKRYPSSRLQIIWNTTKSISPKKQVNTNKLVWRNTITWAHSFLKLCVAALPTGIHNHCSQQCLLEKTVPWEVLFSIFPPSTQILPESSSIPTFFLKEIQGWVVMLFDFIT